MVEAVTRVGWPEVMDGLGVDKLVAGQSALEVLPPAFAADEPLASDDAKPGRPEQLRVLLDVKHLLKLAHAHKLECVHLLRVGHHLDVGLSRDQKS